MKANTAIPSVHAVPAELWGSVFDSLDLDDLIRVSAVCRELRSYAFDHTTFWKYVEITTCNEKDVEWAKLRIKKGRGKPAPFVLGLLPELVSDGTMDFIVDTLVTSLHRLKELKVSLDVTCQGRLWEALARPAPKLEHFMLKLTDLNETLPGDMPELPSVPVLFAAQAPLLRCVNLVDIALPSSPIRAFSHVSRVVYTARFDESRMINAGDDPYAWQDFPSDLFTVFPAMQQLRVSGGHFSFDNTEGKPFDRLQMLCIQGAHDEDVDDLLHALPFRAIPIVEINSPPETKGKIVMSFPVPFAMELSSSRRGETIILHIRVHSKKLGRSLLWSFDGTPETQLLHELARRTIDLRISMELWGVLQFAFTHLCRPPTFITSDAPSYPSSADHLFSGKLTGATLNWYP